MKVLKLTEEVAKSIIEAHKYAFSDQFMFDALDIEAHLAAGLEPDKKLVNKVCSALLKNNKGIEKSREGSNFPTLDIKYGKLLFTVMFGQGTSMGVKLCSGKAL